MPDHFKCITGQLSDTMSNIRTNTDPCLINKPGIQVDLK